MAWQEPKTNWTSDDALNYKDYNRIKNNLLYLHDQVCMEWGNFEIQNMGEDLNFIKTLYDAKYFNAFEANIDLINQQMLKEDYGFRQTFYYNGAFPKPEEFNRIESTTLRMKRITDGKRAGKIRLAFRMGAPKGLKV